MNKLKSSNLFIQMSVVFLVFIIAIGYFSTKTDYTPMHIDLDGTKTYIREGFISSDLLMPDLNDESWFVIDESTYSAYNAGFLKQYEQPVFSLIDAKPKEFTYVIKFNTENTVLTYMRRNSIMPALFLPRIGDNWEAYLNGNLLKREMDIDENGEIIAHHTRTYLSVPFESSYLKENDNLLVFRFISTPDYHDLGLSDKGFYIDDYQIIQKANNGFVLFMCIGIYVFVIFYNILIYLRNPQDKYHMYFSLVTLWLAIYTTSKSQVIGLLVHNTFPIKIIEYMIFTSMGITVILFVKNITKGKITVMDKGIIFVVVAISMTYMFGGLVFSGDMLKVGMFVVISTIIYASYFMYSYVVTQIKLHREQHIELKLIKSVLYVINNTLCGNMLIGFTISAIAMIIGVIMSLYGIAISQNILIMMFSFVISMSFALNDDVTRTKMLTINQNSLLEEIVEERTSELALQVKVANAANESKSRFLATMSHEIRTPMNAILGISEIQLMRDELDTTTVDAIKKIQNSGHGLLGIINDILDLSKIETGKLEINPIEYDVPSLINDAVQLNIVRIGSKPIKFTLNVDENIPLKMFGDELRIKQILNNILSNAIKYTDTGYVILNVSHAVSGDNIQFKFIVEDSGQGMKPEDKDKLFSEYMRFNSDANRTTEGSGLGLTITKQLVEMMNGEINVQSVYGKGSTVTVKVMQKRIACDVIGKELSKNLCNFLYSNDKVIDDLNFKREPMTYGKVLIVDDVETNLYVAKGLMANYKLQIETEDNGFSVISKIKSGNEYDIIFMDHMMPELDGIETTKLLREYGYKGPIVALTANALVGNDALFRQNGFDDFISKPINVRRLNAILNKFVRDRHPEEAKKEAISIVENKVINTPTPELLEVFKRDAIKALEVLHQFKDTKDIKLLTTTVHAMKSALANINENEKSKMALELEKAGHNNDKKFILENISCFITTLEEITETASSCDNSENSNQNDIIEDITFLKEQLIIINKSCEDYDDTTALNALDLLQTKQWNKTTANKITDIRDILYLHSDFDDAVLKTKLWIDEILMS